MMDELEILKDMKNQRMSQIDRLRDEYQRAQERRKSIKVERQVYNDFIGSNWDDRYNKLINELDDEYEKLRKAERQIEETSERIHYEIKQIDHRISLVSK
jgi:predicted  nucleic acid-binding Zn-ribbon protein